MTRPSLSPFADWLLGRLIPAHWRDSVEGDLIEERGRRQQAGQSTGWLWEACAAIAVGARLAVETRSATAVAPDARATRRGSIEALQMDFRLAARALLANRLYASLAIVTLALSVGANAAVFNIANWLLFRPVPGVDRPADLVNVRFRSPSLDSMTPVSLDEVQVIAKGAPALEGLTGFMGVPMSVSIGREGVLRRVPVEFVMSNYFDVLHARVEGRGFTLEEERGPTAPPVAIVGRLFAEQQFPGESPVGKLVRINGQTTTIVGVAPRAFRGTRLMATVDLWMPIAQRYVALPSQADRPSIENSRGLSLFSLAGRLVPGQTAAVLQQQLDEVDRGITAETPTSTRFGKSHFFVLSSLEFYGPARDSLVRVFAVLIASTVLLLVLGCANVGNTILARAMSRSGEIATRLALGASRPQIARLLLVESLLLSSAAVIVALGIAAGAARLLEGSVVIPQLPPLERAVADWRVVVWAIAVSTTAAVLAGLSPMWAVRGIEITQVLQAAGRSVSRGRRGLRRGLMVIQVAVSVVLLIIATLLVRSVSNRTAIDPGFDAARIRTFSIDPRLPPNRSTSQLHQEVIDRVQAIPGVRRASLAFFPPFYVGTESQLQFHTDDAPENLRVALNSVRLGFFETIGLPIVAGRDFTEAELNSSEPVNQAPVVLSESAARRAFGTSAVAGRTIISSTGIRREIVGVVRQSRQRGLTRDDTDDIAFQPYRPSQRTPFVTVVVGVSRPDIDIWPELRRAVSDADSSLVIFDTRRAEDGIRADFGRVILAMRLALVFGGLAVALAGAGLYAVLVRSLAERRREFGIRSALGAAPIRIGMLVVREAGAVLPFGLAAGILFGVWLTRFLDSSLYGVSRLDIVSFLGAAALVTLALAAASIPVCRRATRVDPVEALKE